MNTLIKDIWDKAAKTHSGESWEELTAFMNCFAELIVVKCANIVWDEAEKTMNKEINEVGYELLKQFGIEE